VNEMPTIKFNFLGVGSAFSKKYGNTSALVAVENDGIEKRLLIDCGRTTPDDLVNAGYTWADIDAIFISHIHGDHVYGLEEAGFMSRYVYNRKPHIIFPHPKLQTDLWDKVLKGTMMNGDLDRIMTFDDYFTFQAVNREEAFFDFNDVMFSVYPTLHIRNKKSYGLIIGEKDYVIYTADSKLNKDLIDIAFNDGCKAIFHDCQFMHNEQRVHTSLDDLMTLREDLRKTIHIMHYGDNLADFNSKVNESGMSVTLRNKEYQFQLGSNAFLKKQGEV
jgi:hydroxyacylglutathione hydrolase